MQQDFAALRKHGALSRWGGGWHVLMAAVVVGNSAGLAANIAAAVWYQYSAKFYSTASVYYAANNNSIADMYRSSAREHLDVAVSIASVQMAFEVSVLLLIDIAFATAGVMCARRIASGLLALPAASAAAQEVRTLRLQIVATTGFVFVAFLLRSIQSAMIAVAFGRANYSSDVCPDAVAQNFCNASCFSVSTILAQWSVYTPEFQTVVVLISSPLALLLALWGMTSKLTLQFMRPKQQQALLSAV
jgi:hypothetical protein